MRHQDRFSVGDRVLLDRDSPWSRSHRVAGRIVVDQLSGPARLPPVGSDDADIVVERHFMYGSPVLAVRFQTPTALDWAKRNRHPDVPGEDSDGLWACHPKALQTIVGARREGLVVVVEGETK